MMKRAGLALAAAVVFAAPAAAQDGEKVAAAPAGPLTVDGMTALVAAEDSGRSVPEFGGASVGEIDDMEVFGANDEEVGEVERVLATTEGTVAAVVVEVGGFLGIGDKEVIVPLDRLRRVGDLLTTDLTEEELEQLPEWEG